MTASDRAAYIAGMRKLMDILEADPGLPLPTEGTRLPLGWGLWDDGARDQMAALARAIPCRWEKSAREGYDGGPAYFDLTGSLDGVTLAVTAHRDAVCTRVVVGTEDREVQETVTPAVTRTVIKPAEVVEWQCGPLLAGPEGTAS
jgi:hypothetical protein